MTPGPAQGWTPDARGPLDGVRVLDMTRVVAGNMLTLQLADFGADVLKLEPLPGGDALRDWVEHSDDGERTLSAWWKVYARNKRSVALDFRRPEAIGLIRRLAGTAQVLVENFRPGTLEEMGLAPESLHRIDPALIVVRVSGWGQTGAYRSQPGFGSLIEGFSGFAARHGRPDGPPMLPNMALADLVAGLSGAMATMVALREVEVNGGRGQVIDVSLLEPLASFFSGELAAYGFTGRLPARGATLAAPRNVYRCSDGAWVAMSASIDAMAHRLFVAMGRPGMVTDPRYRDHRARLARSDELDAMMQDFLGAMTREQALAFFREHGITGGPVNDFRQYLDDPHVQSREAVVAMADADAGTVTMHPPVPRLGATPGVLRRPAPRLGEHTDEVLAELGLDAVQRDDLRRRGIVG
jgi:crotonobetainyl-CoA:carnitine CoA-transferase CaiB-like acyl-CoA transferase